MSHSKMLILTRHFLHFCEVEPLVSHYQAQLDVILLHVITCAEKNFMCLKYGNSAFIMH